MASGLYQAFKESLCDRSIHSGVDLDTDDIWGLLVTADQDANLNTHQDRADITQEVPATGNYVAGGVDIGACTVTASAGTVTFDSPDPAWTNVTIADIDGIVLYKNSGAAATDLLIGYWDLGPQTVTAANFTVAVNASGWFTLA
jgi:hypothetical protein